MNGIIDRIPFKNIMVLRTSIIILSGYGEIKLIMVLCTSIIILSGYGEIKLKVLFFLLSSTNSFLNVNLPCALL